MGFIRMFFLGVLASTLLLATARAQQPCVRIYYDSSRPESNWYFGRIHATVLENLLGHFPQYQRIIEPIDNYKSGDLDQCRAAFYLGGYFDNPIPTEFLVDFAHTRSNVMWVGYNIWQLDSQHLPGDVTVAKTLGFTYGGLTQLDRDKLDKDKKPGFFKNVLYKNESFTKFGEWDQNGGKDPQGRPAFNAAWEQIILKRPTIKIPDRDPRKPPKEEIDKNAPGVVLAEVEHSSHKNEKLPWAIRNGNKFYVADMPFAYMTESDRYLVFADLIFDVLGEQPRYPGKKPAVIRLEDISSCTGFDELRMMGSVLKDKKVPFHMATIPIYANPQGISDECKDDYFVPMTTRPDFQQVLREMRDAGGTFIWHGVTHQYTDPQNPRGPKSGLTGDDFEFWDETTRVPVPEDSVNWALTRLEMGWTELERSGIRPQIWEFPHYEGSALDYQIVSRLFSWQIGRFAYTLVDIFGKPDSDPRIWFEFSGTGGATARAAAFKDLRVQYGPIKPFNMMYPYESYGDIYGQRNLPENLNYATSWDKKSAKQYGQWTIGNMIDNIKRNRVLRDQWASFFIHPYLIENKDKGPLKKIIDEVRGAGYEFINLEQFIADKKTISPPPIIERYREDGADRWESRVSSGGVLMSLRGGARRVGPSTSMVPAPEHAWPAPGMAAAVDCAE